MVHLTVINQCQTCRHSCSTAFKYVICNCNCNCNCNYILFTKLPWPGDSEGTFRSSSQAATCPPVYHTRRRLHTVPLIAERQAGKLWIPLFIVFGLTRPGIEPESTASVADALSTRPLIGFICTSNTAEIIFCPRNNNNLLLLTDYIEVNNSRKEFLAWLIQK